MLLPTAKDWLRSAAGAGIAAAIFIAYLSLRSEHGFGAVFLHWDRILAVILLIGVGILCSLWLVRARYQQVLQTIINYLEDYRNNPSASAEKLQNRLPGSGDDLQKLTQSLESLCASYRKALSDRVTQDAALESLRSMLGRVDLEKGFLQGGSLRGNTTSRDMVARFTPNLHWLTATPTLQHFLGQQIADLNGKLFLEQVYPEDTEIVRQAVQTTLQTGEAHYISFRVRVRPGSDTREISKSGKNLNRSADEPTELRHVQADMLARYNELGNPLHIRCYLVDVTERVKAENELRRRTKELSQTNERLRQINLDLQRLKESYRDLYHNAPVIYFSLDASGQFVTFNDTMLETLGYSRAELYKQPYTRLLTPESKKRFLQDQGAYLPWFRSASPGGGEVESQWVKKDGTVIDVWIRNTPLQDETGQFVRSRSVAQDVTERNRLADELRRRGDELERVNADLLKINNALDEFTGVVSHDLKEPLRTLESYSTFLAEEYSSQLGQEGIKDLNYLRQASRRLSNLIADLLVLAQAGRITQDLQAFDLAETVSTVCKDLDDLIQRKNAVVVIEGTLPAILGDSPRIAQLLSNLITNGIKYNSSESPRITIGQKGGAGGNGQPEAEHLALPKKGDFSFVTLYVADNGIGIDPAYHDQVFGIFRRLHEAEKYEGTGAGLAIAKKIVEAHGGCIWVESQPGQGATFFFTLPQAILPSAPPQIPQVVASSRGDRRTRSQRNTKTIPERKETSIDWNAAKGKTENNSLPEPVAPVANILLVEDMPEIALIAQKLAKRAGYEMHWLSTAEAAWDYLQHNHPELVLLDIHLPGMSGVDLCKMLRGSPHLQDLTIALFSQLEHPEAVAAGRSAGANHVLSKDLLCHGPVWQRKLDEILAGTKVRESV